MMSKLVFDKSSVLCTDQILFLVCVCGLFSKGGWLATQSTPSGSAPDFAVSDIGIVGEESEFPQQESNLGVSSPDTLPLSNRGLVAARPLNWVQTG